MLGVAVPYPEFFFFGHNMYRNQDFNKSIGECTVKRTDQQNLWLYLVAFRCQTTEQSCKKFRYEERTVIKLIKVKQNW